MEFHKQHILTSVVACIIDEQSRVLLTRRCIEPFCGQWVMPGGKIDHGEPLLEALHREVREEVGLQIHVDRLLDVYEHVAHGANRSHYVILYYRAHPLSLELAPNGDEVTEAVWVSADRLVEFNMTPGTRHILAQVYPGQLRDPGQPDDELANRDLAENLRISG
ncbi:MAG: DNA mismatch repair protein MutT [Desulfuromonas sp.]|nr:MAG: DNA mismatch repair protein MutT [Desulfuromonas sp.]